MEAARGEPAERRSGGLRADKNCCGSRDGRRSKDGRASGGATNRREVARLWPGDGRRSKDGRASGGATDRREVARRWSVEGKEDGQGPVGQWSDERWSAG
jgi:hypothetical protein